VPAGRFTLGLLGALSRWDANHWRDAEEVGRLLHLLDDEPGDASSPVAHAVACLRGVDADEVARIHTALHRFAARGAVARRQVDVLEPWLDSQ
jgi:hypothetical protein